MCACEQEKKEKPVGPPPFDQPLATRFEIVDSLCGISICVEMNNLLEGHEKIFCVLFVGNMNLQSSDTTLSPTTGSECQALVT